MQEKNKKYLAIFDLDGTLVDTKNINYSAYEQALSESGYHLDYRYFIEECNGKNYNEFLPPVIPDCNEDILNKIHCRKKELYPSYLGKAKINRHLFHILGGLAETYWLALATTASRTNALQVLGYFGKESVFDLIIAQEDVKCLKPDPEALLYAMNYFKISPENTIVFEDSDVGAAAARAAGATLFLAAEF